MLIRFALLVFLAFGSNVAWAEGEIALMPGEVIQGHAKLEADCKECHIRFDKDAQKGLCKDCHKEVKADVLNHKGFHGTLDEKECRVCHTDHKGRSAKIVVFDESKFNHEKTDFPLQGAHKKQDKVRCLDCHEAKKKFREAPMECNGCHRKDDKHKGSLGTECTNCHTVNNWKEAKFDHSKTKFLLTGKHVDVKCTKCHVEAPASYKEAPMACVGCHLKVDKHKGQYGKKCESCHVDKSWKTIEFEHDKETKFKLLGKHTVTKCLSCHKEPLFKGIKTPDTCIGCHKKDDTHKGNFGEKCVACHNEEKWKTFKFDHDKETKFKLLGKHTATKCVSCHKEPLFVGIKTPDTCISCHKKDDVHKGGLGEKCATCHNEEKWKTFKFDHDKDTKYPLLGKHITTKCDACHIQGMKEKIATTCIGCHKIDDKHKSDFGIKCESCHKEKDWKTNKFDHTRDTKYPLKDKHEKVKCVSCHTGKLYEQKLTQECVSCHKKDDVHKDKLGKRCESCHEVKGWKNATIDHSRSRFPLLGAHNVVECKKCHLTQIFKDTPLDCFACHKKDDETIHKQRLGRKCETCHNARSWKTWDFNHDKRTKFKLEGGHKKPGCYACHKQVIENEKFIVERTCGNCHEKDDKHQGEFGQLCERCHIVADWRTLLVGGGTRSSQ